MLLPLHLHHLVELHRGSGVLHGGVALLPSLRTHEQTRTQRRSPPNSAGPSSPRSRAEAPSSTISPRKVELGSGSAALGTHLDVPVENGLGESLQGRALGWSQAGLGVEQGDAGGVSGEGVGVGIAQHLEVVVDGVTDHHLSHQQLQDLPAWETNTDHH